MLRLTELALLAAPFVAFAVWRLTAPHRIPVRVLAMSAVAAAAISAAIIWFGLSRALPPNETYVPARIGASGKIVSQ